MITSRGSRSVLLRLALLVGSGALVAPLLATPSGAVPAVVAADPKPNPHRAQQAVAALERVETLVARAGASPTAARSIDLTLELRDLALLRDELSRTDRARASQLLARPLRPAKSKRVCSPVICVHWQTKAQSKSNGVRSRRYVTQVLRTMTNVHKKYVAAGYNKPAPDGKRGGNKRPDVYLANVGVQGFYGYCTTDDRRPPRHGRTFGFCVLDNDYSKSEFPFHTPLENMRVTGAHEYFHNVQFGHDIGEDGWFMEATATWAEDEVFDKINDNAFYLPRGPIAYPTAPLDTFGSGKRLGLYHYGTWIFFRYLTDRYGTKVAGLDDLVLRMWKRASGKERSRYSLAAVEDVLASEGIDLAEELAEFSAGNRRPSITYAAEFAEVAADRENEEGYPRAPLAGTLRLGAGDSDSFNASYKHLAARTYRFVPKADAGAGSALGLELTLADVGAAVITTKETGQAPTSQYVATDGPQAPIGFADADVDWVEVTIVNASDRFTCWRGSNYSCAGISRDDGVKQGVAATVTP